MMDRRVLGRNCWIIELVILVHFYTSADYQLESLFCLALLLNRQDNNPVDEYQYTKT
jgi:hypothetical protein